MTEGIKTFRTVLYSSIFYVEDIEATSQEAAEARMRELWEQCSIEPDRCAEEITGIEANELEPEEVRP
jgi:hypothetical protein